MLLGPNPSIRDHSFGTENRFFHWFEGNFVLLLHGASILTYFYINHYLNKRSIFSVKELHAKVGKWGKSILNLRLF